MRIVSVVGARPQFIKASVLSRVIRRKHTEILVHTGQHYDANMSAVFFEELGIPDPDYHLGIGSGPHGAQTGAMMAGIERVLQEEQPDWVLTYGDTNSTLAGAIAASKLHIRVAHVEAGLRSFNRMMPEEVNRILTDHVSELLFCPSQVAADNLTQEGITKGVHVVGDVMYPALMFAVDQYQHRSDILKRLNLTEKRFVLATVHRSENTDNLDRLRSIMLAFEAIGETIVFPVHPRTRMALDKLGVRSETQIGPAANIRFVEPLGYLEMVGLESQARLIVTDSGGIQKEAYWLAVPCVTLRDETEWVETMNNGWNQLAGADTEKIIRAVQASRVPEKHPDIYSSLSAGECCLEILDEFRP
jgi:UDP-GlcNAc3NAcA epimerase